MNEVLKLKEINDLKNDYAKCDFYLNHLNSGNINYLNESIDFSNKKFAIFTFYILSSFKDFSKTQVDTFKT